MEDAISEALIVGGGRGDGTTSSRRSRAYLTRCVSHAQDELKTFRSYLRWLCVDQSNIWTACLSWSMFVFFGLFVPIVSHFLLACSSCDGRHDRPFDVIVQVSLSSAATVSFICLSSFVRKYGLRRFLFFDKLWDESETVRKGYTDQLNATNSDLAGIAQCLQISLLIVESAYKIWWYASGASQIPFLGNVYLSDAVACIMEILSWFYRTTIIFLVCVLFRLVCSLQILRLQDFAQLFQKNSDVGSVLSEHFRIRKHLRIISHRYRAFILWSLILVTGSQFSSLLVTTKYSSEVNIYRAGELALCSITLVTSLLILLRNATKITHKAQSITCLAAKWHICATLDDSLDVNEDETPVASAAAPGIESLSVGIFEESDGEDAGDEEDELDNSKLIPAHAYCTISFQKRQALVNYFENNIAGLTVYGFTLDRGAIHTIFGIELSLVLWLLGKTIGIS